MELKDNCYLFHRKNHTVVGRILAADGQYASVEWYDPTWKSTSEEKVYVPDYLKHLSVLEEDEIILMAVYALNIAHNINVSNNKVRLKGVTSTLRGHLFNISVITDRCIFDASDLAERGFSVSTVHPEDL